MFDAQHTPARHLQGRVLQAGLVLCLSVAWGVNEPQKRAADVTCRDKVVGMSMASEVACILVGLTIMTIFRFVRVPLLEVCPPPHCRCSVIRNHL